MRKVKVFQRVYNPATKQWETVERGIARFRQFGADYEEFEAGPGNYTTAVIEWPDGKVEMVRADMVQFLEPEGRDLVGEMCEFSDDGVNWKGPDKCVEYRAASGFPFSVGHGATSDAFRYARPAAVPA
jgi:hypothetical protein